MALPCAVSLALSCGGRHVRTPSSPAPPQALAAPTVPPSSPPAGPEVDPNLSGPDAAALDRSSAPCDDFYQFACGGWMKATPVPDDEASWVRSFSVIHEQNQSALRSILERDARGEAQGDAYARPLGDFWTTCMDEPTIERRGASDLKPELARIDGVRDETTLAKELAALHSIGVGAVFNLDSEVDAKNAERMIAGISQGGLGLPERDYYFRDDPRTKDIRSEYEAHVARTLALLGESRAAAEADAKTVMKVETELARVSMPNVELRDPQKVYHLVNLDGLKQLAPAVGWDGYLGAMGFPGIVAINVAQPDFVKRFDAMTKTVPPADWRAYLRWHLASSMSPLLSKKFLDEWFHFRQVLTGTKTLQPRWKRCVRFTDQLLGEALAQPFVKEHLGEDGKHTAEQMVAGIEASMRVDIDGLSWMDDATRTRAEEKLAKIVNKIGYPAKWRRYDGLAIDRASFVGNVASATAFEVKRRLSKVGKPVDKDEWEMTPPTVNAYYEPTMNEMVFPAGILQAPFYGRAQSPALNFGGIGMVVGHELTHGFDDEGRQFDERGNLRDWWTQAVSAEFDRRASCVAKQYDDYVAVDEQHIRGRLTLGENIADLGGVKLAFASFQKAERAHPATPALGGFTPEQQFFLGFAQSWCANYRPEALRLLVATNPHSPPKYRVDGPLSNLSAFAAAFQCKEGSPMVRSSQTRCEIW
ncbi:MAG: M13 family metallopeptidase [Myxococcota bacterium]|nr:M13 family metallopeptidase [Myxococcota bacterium]